MGKKNLIAAIFLLTAFILAIYLNQLFHFKIDLVLASLMAAIFFLGLEWFLIILLLSIALLSYQPAISLEMIIIFGLSLLFYYLKDYLPFKKIINFLIFFILFFLVFYSFSYKFLLTEFNVFIIDFAISLIFGLLEFAILSKTDKKL